MEVKNSTRAVSNDFSRCFSLPGVQCILCLLLGFSLTGVQCIRCPRYRKSRSLTFFGRSILSRQLIGNRFAYDSKHACAKKVERTAPTDQPQNWRNKRMREAVHVQDVGTCPAYKLSACQSVHLSVCQSHRLPVWWSITGEWLRH